MKSITSVSIDSELKRMSQKRGLNLSEELEKALRRKLGTFTAIEELDSEKQLALEELRIIDIKKNRLEEHIKELEIQLSEQAKHDKLMKSRELVLNDKERIMLPLPHKIENKGKKKIITIPIDSPPALVQRLEKAGFVVETLYQKTEVPYED